MYVGLLGWQEVSKLWSWRYDIHHKTNQISWWGTDSFLWLSTMQVRKPVINLKGLYCPFASQNKWTRETNDFNTRSMITKCSFLRVPNTFFCGTWNLPCLSTVYYYYYYYYSYIRYTSVIASDFLSQHPSPNHGPWEAKGVSTWWRGPAWEGGL